MNIYLVKRNVTVPQEDKSDKENKKKIKRNRQSHKYQTFLQINITLIQLDSFVFRK
jgi:hypothetical protein